MKKYVHKVHKHVMLLKGAAANDARVFAILSFRNTKNFFSYYYIYRLLDFDLSLLNGTTL